MIGRTCIRRHLIPKLGPGISIKIEDIFRPYFDGALSSGAAFAIIDNQTGTIIGTSRYHDYKEAERCGVTTAEVPGLCDVLGPTGAVR